MQSQEGTPKLEMILSQTAAHLGYRSNLSTNIALMVVYTKDS